MGAIFNNRFNHAKGNLEENIKNMADSGLAVERKCKSKKPQSLG